MKDGYNFHLYLRKVRGRKVTYVEMEEMESSRKSWRTLETSQYITHEHCNCLAAIFFFVSSEQVRVFIEMDILLKAALESTICAYRCKTEKLNVSSLAFDP